METETGKERINIMASQALVEFAFSRYLKTVYFDGFFNDT